MLPGPAEGDETVMKLRASQSSIILWRCDCVLPSGGVWQDCEDHRQPGQPHRGPSDSGPLVQHQRRVRVQRQGAHHLSGLRADLQVSGQNTNRRPRTSSPIQPQPMRLQSPDGANISNSAAVLLL